MRLFLGISFFSRTVTSFPPTGESSKDTAVILNAMKLSLPVNRYLLPSRRKPLKKRIVPLGEIPFTVTQVLC
jgi:hypothetical protein